MIKYLGSKRVLVPLIVDVISQLENVRTVVDLFSGTARVGHALKKAKFEVTANDMNHYAYTLAQCYVAADADLVREKVEKLIAELSHEAPRAGYFTHTFCEQSRFFHPKNGERIDAMRERIASWGLEPHVEAILLVSLMEAADRVDSTTGVQMAYLKSWAPRAHHDLELRLPDIVPGKGHAVLADATKSAKELTCDVVYADPPYNQHSYLGNYHIWESLVRWDKPEVYGIACKRVDCREGKSDWNSKRKIRQAFRDLIQSIHARYLVLSFNNEGYLSREDILTDLEQWGPVRVIETDFKRYVGAQIGIYNPQGEKVGKVSHLRNKEYLFVVGPSRSSEVPAAECSSVRLKMPPEVEPCENAGILAKILVCFLKSAAS
jgi:adenine-specific DNA-methyltransferase